MMPVLMQLDGLLAEVQGRKRLHICHSQIGAEMFAFVVMPAAARNISPSLEGELRERLIGLTSHCDFASRFAQGCSRCCGRMRTDGDLCSAATQGREPLLRHPKLRWRTTPEQIRRCGRNHEEVRMKVPHRGSYFGRAQVLDVCIYQKRFAVTPNHLVTGEH